MTKEKYLMSEKTLKMWKNFSGHDTYGGVKIEIDNSIPYGALEHIED